MHVGGMQLREAHIYLVAVLGTRTAYLLLPLPLFVSFKQVLEIRNAIQEDRAVQACHPAKPSSKMRIYDIFSQLMQHCSFRGWKIQTLGPLTAHVSLQVCVMNYKKCGEAFWNQFYLCPITDALGVVEYFIGECSTYYAAQREVMNGA
jgi:hypothetical protein